VVVVVVVVLLLLLDRQPVGSSLVTCSMSFVGLYDEWKPSQNCMPNPVAGQ
jgi:hypothetical protein